MIPNVRALTSDEAEMLRQYIISTATSAYVEGVNQMNPNIAYREQKAAQATEWLAKAMEYIDVLSAEPNPATLIPAAFVPPF